MIFQRHAILLFLFLFCCFNSITFVEAINTTSCINKLLFSSKEWVACRTDFNVDILNCRTCFNDITANASNFCQFVLWVDSLSHNNYSYFLARQCRKPGQHYMQKFFKRRKRCIIPLPLTIKPLPQDILLLY